MTAFKKYERLEASGLWRRDAQDQKREVIVSVGDTTLVISDLNEQPLAHWSLASIARADADEGAVVFHPQGDPCETLELDANSVEMIDAISKLQAAIARARPHPGRLRWISAGGSIALICALAFFWLPGALADHVVRVVPSAKTAQISASLLVQSTRVTGAPCTSAQSANALTALARRTGAKRVLVVTSGTRRAFALPDRTVIVSSDLLEQHDSPEVVAGYILAELERVKAKGGGLYPFLEYAGLSVMFRLLTTGETPHTALKGYAETHLSNPLPPVAADSLIDVFEQTRIHAEAYARDRDPALASTQALIELEQMRSEPAQQIMTDSDWLRLQSICAL